MFTQNLCKNEYIFTKIIIKVLCYLVGGVKAVARAASVIDTTAWGYVQLSHAIYFFLNTI